MSDFVCLSQLFLQQTNICPFSSVTIESGHFGMLMARERSHGFYPVTIATLDLIKELVAIVSHTETNGGSRINDFIACVVFVCRDVFTGYQKWYYGDLREKQEIGKYLHGESSHLGSRMVPVSSILYLELEAKNEIKDGDFGRQFQSLSVVLSARSARTYFDLD